MKPSSSEISEYLRFERREIKGRKTPVVTVHSKNLGIVLGEIRWFGRWRQFCFYPADQTIWNIGCMNDIAYVIRDLHEERRQS